MKIQVLMSVMNNDHSIVEQANIQTDAIIINQTDQFQKEVFSYHKHKIQFLSFDERGIGLSRNNALMRADADVVLFADTSALFVDDYPKIIADAFKKIPDADMIVFNLPCEDAERQAADITKIHRVRKYNSLRYGTVRMAIKMEAVKRANLSFSLLFGGGAKYSSGEDSLFIFTALNRGLKVYAVPSQIGVTKLHQSTWFKGYTNKFFHDKGALFKALSPKFYVLLILQFIVRKRKIMGRNRSFQNMFQLMMQGAKEFDR